MFVMTKLLVLLGVLCIPFLLFGIFAYSTVTGEIDLRKDLLAQQQSNQARFDTMWKIIKTKANISDKYSKDFKTIYPDLIKGRYSDGGGSLMKWIQEHNPEFDTSLYKDLMASVEAERTAFFKDQQELIRKKAERDKLLEYPVSGWVLRHFGDASPVEIVIITSDETNDAFESGREGRDAVDLFDDKQAEKDKDA